MEKDLPQGDRLYRGAEIRIQKDPEVKEKTGSLKKTIELATRPRQNKYLLGQPYKVWFWYRIGISDKEGGFRGFLRKKLAEPPVLGSRVNVKAASENIQSLMENLGYFHTRAKGDTQNSGPYTRAIYQVEVKPQYRIRDVKWVTDSTQPLLTLIRADAEKNSLIKPGQPYRLSDITAERERIDQFLKTRGYYFFHPEYIMAYADSTPGRHQVDLLFNLKRSAPAEARQVWQIRRISVHPNYNLGDELMPSDSSRTHLAEDIRLVNDKGDFRASLFSKAITYRSDSVYNSTLVNGTLNRLISLGTFKFVRSRFDTIAENAGQHQLDVEYFLTPTKRKSLQSSLDAFTKDNSFVGSKLSVNWRHRNLFRGAEQLMVKVYGGFEVALADSLKVNNNYRVGTEVSLRMPAYALPFIRIRDNGYYPANTSLTFGYEWYQKKLYYTKNFFRLQYDFIRKPDARSQIQFAPVSLSYVNATQVTDSFYRELERNPSLLVNVYNESILGTILAYSRFTEKKKFRWFYSAGIDLSGNLAGLITGARNYREKMILNAPFAQYVKMDVDVHHTRYLGRSTQLASRILLGIGIPYNNSRALPFSKLYTIGGASSLRGFNAGSIGPGALTPSAQKLGLYQIIGGDMKLLFNTELRLPLTKQLSYALFVDAGNTWTRDTLLFGAPGKLESDFYREIAVSTGMGIRFDIGILVFRLDMGMPLRKPWLPEGQRWVFRNISPSASQWRRENLILNIAIGMPF